MSNGDQLTLDQPNEPRSLVDVILNTGLELFTDSTGIARLRRPTDGLDEYAWPVDSEPVTTFIAWLAYEQDRRLLRGGELAALLRVLKGIAYTNVRRDGDAFNLVDLDPVLRAVLRLLSSASHWKGPAAKLLIALRSEMVDESIDFNRDKAWPKDPARLSVRLRDLQPAFDRLGISHSKSRTARQRSHTLERVRDHLPQDDAGPSSLSSTSSSLNAGASGSLRMNDGGDGQMEDFAECPAD